VVVDMEPEDTVPNGAVEDEPIDVSDDPPERARGSADARTMRRARRIARRVRRIWGVGAGVWIGLFVVAAGFGLLAITWGQVAALLDVSAQIPYLVSGGLVGIGLILVGLLLINLSVKRREARARERQLEEVREALVGLRQAIQDDGEDSA
jgi:hypothetical protein